MKVSLDTSSPSRLRVALGMPVGTRLGVSLIGLFFLALGSLFIFSSLPHTEFLILERSLQDITCTRGQALAGRWVLSEQTLVMKPDVRATIEWVADEGETTYRMLIQGSSGALYFGKTKSTLQEAQSITRQVNRFLEGTPEPHYEWVEEVWWWFLAPFGLLGCLAGLFTIGLANYRDRWIMDQVTGTVTQRTWAVFPLRRKQWLLTEFVGCRMIGRTDSDRDMSTNLVLLHLSGKEIKMSSVSQYLRRPDAVNEAARRIHAFLASR